MDNFLTQNEINLDEKQLKKLKERLILLQKDKSQEFDYGYISNLFSSELSLENGYKEFDFDKFTSCVLYFIKASDELLIVKLNKLLNYSDMLFYKQNGVSMTGTRYVHLPYGPVPDQYALLYAMLEKRGIVTSVYEQLDNGYEKHLLKAGESVFDYSFTPQELSVLETVNNKFASFGSKQIADYSHNERGYKETKQGEVISYAYAAEIEL